MVVRILGVALDLFKDAVFDVHQNAAVVVATGARTSIRANYGVAVFFPCPFTTRRIVLRRAHKAFGHIQVLLGTCIHGKPPSTLLSYKTSTCILASKTGEWFIE